MSPNPQASARGKLPQIPGLDLRRLITQALDLLLPKLERYQGYRDQNAQQHIHHLVRLTVETVIVAQLLRLARLSPWTWIALTLIGAEVIDVAAGRIATAAADWVAGRLRLGLSWNTDDEQLLEDSFIDPHHDAHDPWEGRQVA